MFDEADFSWMDMEARWTAQNLSSSHSVALVPTDAHRILLDQAIALEQDARNLLVSRLHLGSDIAFRVLRKLPYWFFNPGNDLEESQLFEWMNMRWNGRRIDRNHSMRYWAWHGWMRALQEVYPFMLQIERAGSVEALPATWMSKVPRRSGRGRRDFRAMPDFVVELGGRVVYVPGVGTIATERDFPMNWDGAVAGIRYRPAAQTSLRLKVVLWNPPGTCDFRQASYSDPVFAHSVAVVNYFNIRSAAPSLVQTGFGELDPILLGLFEESNENYWRRVIEFLTDALGTDEAISIVQNSRMVQRHE